jgi:hypothetical protein
LSTEGPPSPSCCPISGGSNIVAACLTAPLSSSCSPVLAPALAAQIISCQTLLYPLKDPVCYVALRKCLPNEHSTQQVVSCAQMWGAPTGPAGTTLAVASSIAGTARSTSALRPISTAPPVAAGRIAKADQSDEGGNQNAEEAGVQWFEKMLEQALLADVGADSTSRKAEIEMQTTASEQDTPPQPDEGGASWFGQWR